MTKIFSILSTQTLTPKLSFIHPAEPPKVAHLDDPAIEVMVDFKHTHALTIGPSANIDGALLEMKVCNFKVLLVVDEERSVIGLISAEDILGERPIKLMRERRLQRDEIKVNMVMTPQSEIATFDIHELRHAKVGNIVETLHALKQHYALVIQMDDVDQAIRGLFSSSLLSQQLHIDVLADLSEAQTLIELQRDLHD